MSWVLLCYSFVAPHVFTRVKYFAFIPPTVEVSIGNWQDNVGVLWVFIRQWLRYCRIVPRMNVHLTAVTLVTFRIICSIIILTVLDRMWESFPFYNGYLFHASSKLNCSLICIYMPFKNCVLYFVYVIKRTRAKCNQSLMVYYF